MLGNALAAGRQVFSPAFRGILARSLAITVLALVVAGYGLHRVLATLLFDLDPWLATTVQALGGLALIVAAAYALVPIATAVSGLFLDDVAARVERQHYPQGLVGQPPPWRATVFAGLRLFGLAVAANAVAVLFLFVPVVNVLAFLVANAFVLGREYFEAVAMRTMPAHEAQQLRQRHSGRVFRAGLVIAAAMAVPLVNLAAPVFATAFMVHVCRGLPKT